ncbi:hypothetical protein ACU82A_16890 [Bacillus cereus]
MIKIARVVMIIAILIVIIAGLITPFSLKEKGVHTLGMVVYGAIGLGGLTLLDYIIKKAKKREINKNFTNRKSSWWSICKVKKQGE